MRGSERWDAIVVGGGAAGCTAAAYLAAAGQRTLLLEQYDVVGGCSHVFRRKGQWEFDVGVHYLGDCGPEGQLPTLLHGLALDDRIEFLAMDRDGFDTLVRPDMEIRVPVGWDRYLEELIAAFPADARGLRRLFEVFIKLGGAVDRSLTPASMMGSLRMARDAGAAMRWAMRPLSSLLSACGLSPRASAAICMHCGAYGAPPERAPVAMHATYLEDYVGKGAWFPRGGGQVIAAHLIDVIHGHGGTVRTRATVERILIEGGRAVGVRLADGESIPARAVISGADIKRTYLEMIGPEHLRRLTRRRVRRWKMAAPFINLYLGVELDLRERMPNTNYFTAPNARGIKGLHGDLVEGGIRAREQWLAGMIRDMPAFVHCSTVKDPDNPRIAPEGCSSLEVMTAVPPAGQLWSRLEGGRRYQRDPEYLELKEQLAAMLLDRAKSAIPGLEGKVVWQELSTPLTHERYTLSNGGAAYGLEPNTRQFGPLRPGSHTEINGLFLAGAALAWGPGVTGAMLSGMHAAAAVTGRDLPREVRAGAVIADASRLSEPTPDWDPLLASKRLADPKQDAAYGRGAVAAIS